MIPSYHDIYIYIPMIYSHDISPMRSHDIPHFVGETLPSLRGEEFRGKLGRSGSHLGLFWDDGTEWLREDLQGTGGWGWNTTKIAGAGWWPRWFSRSWDTAIFQVFFLDVWRFLSLFGVQNLTVSKSVCKRGWTPHFFRFNIYFKLLTIATAFSFSTQPSDSADFIQNPWLGVRATTLVTLP